jgi:hypothetical protein
VQRRHHRLPPPSTNLRRRLVLAIAAVFLAGSVGGMLALNHNSDVRPGEPTAETPGLVSSPAAPTPSPRPVTVPLSGPELPNAPLPGAPPPGLAASFDELTEHLSASVGMVITPVGVSEPAVRLGDWSTTGPAWSTIKVPLAIAALRQQGSSDSLIDAAITHSDNAAAEQLWAKLGDPANAADRVEDVLSMAGDPTSVQSERIRADYSAFGQTLWPLVEQSTFLSNAVCNPGTAPIFDLMRQVTEDQRWGLGTLSGARFKGGWGPSTDGAYLVRQIGVIDTPSGRAAVAVTALPDSGTFADGTSALTAVADWLGQQAADIPGGRCA